MINERPKLQSFLIFIHNPNMQDSFLQIHKTTMRLILRSPGKLWSESEKGRLAVMASGKSSCRRPETESGFIRSCDATLLKIKEVANLLSIEPVWACGGGWTDGRPPSTPACTSPCCSRRGSLAKLLIMMMLLFEKWRAGKDLVSVCLFPCNVAFAVCSRAHELTKLIFSFCTGLHAVIFVVGAVM